MSLSVSEDDDKCSCAFPSISHGRHGSPASKSSKMECPPDQLAVILRHQEWNKALNVQLIPACILHMESKASTPYTLTSHHSPEAEGVRVQGHVLT